MEYAIRAWGKSQGLMSIMDQATMDSFPIPGPGDCMWERENGRSHGICTGGGKESLFSLTGIQNLCITQVSCPVEQECAPRRGGKVPWDLYSPGNGPREWKSEGSERRAGCRLQSPQLHCFLGPTEFYTARGVCWLICCFTHAQSSALCRWGGLGTSRSQQILFKWIYQSVTNKRTGPRDRMMAVCMDPFAQIGWMATLRASSPFSIPGASPTHDWSINSELGNAHGKSPEAHYWDQWDPFWMGVTILSGELNCNADVGVALWRCPWLGKGCETIFTLHSSLCIWPSPPNLYLLMSNLKPPPRGQDSQG